MNREIKFRSWNKLNKEMDYKPYGDEYICEGTPINDLFTKESQKSMGYILMQYIGLKDKNGKEIYDRDIDQRGYIIKWNQLHCGWALFDGDNCVGDLIADVWDEKGKPPKLWQDSSIEIIGNIYENPELIQHYIK